MALGKRDRGKNKVLLRGIRTPHLCGQLGHLIWYWTHVTVALRGTKKWEAFSYCFSISTWIRKSQHWARINLFKENFTACVMSRGECLGGEELGCHGAGIQQSHTNACTEIGQGAGWSGGNCQIGNIFLTLSLRLCLLSILYSLRSLSGASVENRLHVRNPIVLPRHLNFVLSPFDYHSVL